jgi:tyrosinase
MNRLNRRSFLSTAGAISLSAWLNARGLGHQPAANPKVRYEARTEKGIEMLNVYAQGVKTMVNTKDGDPRSWRFQWYSHFVDGDTTKPKEIARIYPNANDPNKGIAEAMWDMCQAHSGQNEDYFLPWHRCFVLYFEQIIAAVTSRPDFTLPYWNYSTTDNTRGVIPPQFTKQNDPIFGSLFDGKRNPGVNDGQPIQGNDDDLLSLSALTENQYTSDLPTQGFCMDLDQGLHGNIHGLIGNAKNMGAVPYAALDPIFWLHHCNIDRLWASWNSAGYKNPQLDQTFTFVDGKGTVVTANIKDFLDIAPLSYAYDRLEPVPGAAPAVAAMNVAPPRSETIARMSVKGAILGTGSTRIPLATEPGILSLTAHLTIPAPGRHTYLVVSGLSVNSQPGALYSLYLNLPDNPTKQQLADHRLGTINFFGVHSSAHMEPAKHPDGGPARDTRPRFYSFEVTGKVRALGLNKALAAEPSLTIIPIGKPVSDSKPVIGNIELVTR